MANKAVTLYLNIKVDGKWTFRAVYGEPTQLLEPVPLIRSLRMIPFNCFRGGCRHVAGRE